MLRLGLAVGGILIFVMGSVCFAQTKQHVASAASPDVQHAIKLAETGHCAEALPVLKKGLAQVSDKELRRNLGLSWRALRHEPEPAGNALLFLQMLSRDFPHDPDVLYLAVHAYSDLSTRASQELAQYARTLLPGA